MERAIPTNCQTSKASEFAERRLVHRLLEYWRTLCPENGFPTVDQVDPIFLAEIRPHCFILEIGQDGGPPSIRRTGRAFSELHGRLLAGVALTDLASGTLLRNATFFLDEVLTRRVPVSRGGAFADCRGVIRLFRSILLPLSGNGVDIDGILGAANSRAIASDTDEIVYHSASIARPRPVST